MSSLDRPWEGPVVVMKLESLGLKDWMWLGIEADK